MHLTSSKWTEIKLFEAFAGIGAQYRALSNISSIKKWKIKVVGIIEWYIYAIIAYIAINSPDFIPSDQKLLIDSDLSCDSKTLTNAKYKFKIDNTKIASFINYSYLTYNNVFNIEAKNISKLPSDIDIFTYSFPCQDLSSQGLQKGIDKKSKTRSSLLWRVENLLKSMRQTSSFHNMPKYLLMENVKNLVSSKNIKNYSTWINSLEKLGYISKSYILNSKDFGVPQNRERVFLISIRKDYKKIVNYEFPIFNEIKTFVQLKTIIDNKNKNSLDIENETSKWRKTKSGVIKKELINYTSFNSENFIFSPNGIGPTLTASGANSRIKIEISSKKYRYLNASECLKYMGFTLDDYKKMKDTDLLSDSKIIFLSGNSIVVPVLEEIFKTFVFHDDGLYGN